MLEEEVFKTLTESGFPQNWIKNNFALGSVLAAQCTMLQAPLKMGN